MQTSDGYSHCCGGHWVSAQCVLYWRIVEECVGDESKKGGGESCGLHKGYRKRFVKIHLFLYNEQLTQQQVLGKSNYKTCIDTWSSRFLLLCQWLSRSS